MKTYLIDLPKPNFEIPTPSNTNLALVYPLYYGTQGKWLPEHLIRTSAWSANSMMKHTDIMRLNADIIWFVEEELYADKRNIFDENGIHSDNIVLFTSPPSHIESNRISKALYVFESDALKKYDKLLIWDCDLFACTKGVGTYSFADEEWYQTDVFGDGMALLYWHDNMHDSMLRQEGKHWWWNKFATLNNGESYAIMMNKMTEATGLIFNWETTYPHLSGGVKYFVQNKISDEFKRFCIDAEPLIGDEENVFHLWWRKTQKPFYGFLLNWKTLGYDWCYSVGDFERTQMSDKYFFFTHIYDDDAQNKEWETLWRQQANVVSDY